MRFEELLSRPDLVAADLCTFLGVDYDDAMTILSRSHEDRGTAAGALRIVPSTRGRYQTELNPRQVRRIEEVAAPVAKDLGYELEFADRFRPLSPWRMNLYRIHDGVAMTWFYLRDRGPVYSLRHLVGRLSSRS